MNKLYIRSSALPSQFVRISSWLIDKSLSDIQNRTDGDDVIIHNLRKTVKNLRSILKLLRKDTGERFYKKYNYALRDYNRKSSNARNYASLIQIVNELSVENHSPGIIETLNLLRLQLESDFTNVKTQADYEILFAFYKQNLSNYRVRLNKLKLPPRRFTGINSCLTLTYSLGKKNAAASLQIPNEENIHELRKSVKDIYYCCYSLIPLSKNRMRSYTVKLKSLADDLGTVHDLFELQKYIETLPQGLIDCSEVLITISGTRRKLLDASFRSTAKIYKENSKDFSARIKSYYKLYRKNSYSY